MAWLMHCHAMISPDFRWLQYSKSTVHNCLLTSSLTRIWRVIKTFLYQIYIKCVFLQWLDICKVTIGAIGMSRVLMAASTELHNRLVFTISCKRSIHSWFCLILVEVKNFNLTLFFEIVDCCQMFDRHFSHHSLSGKPYTFTLCQV